MVVVTAMMTVLVLVTLMMLVVVTVIMTVMVLVTSSCWNVLIRISELAIVLMVIDDKNVYHS